MPGLLLMEHAAIGATLLALQALTEVGTPPHQARITIACGPGNNGGDGYAVARHLHNAGVTVTVLELASAEQFAPNSDAGINRRLAQRWGIAMLDARQEIPLPACDICVDALFGTGLTRPPTGRFAAIIDSMNAATAPILAIDIPSGLDADRGVPLEHAIRARWTATFGLVKQGFLEPTARAFTGSIFCVPIGIPRELLPSGVPPFPPAPIAVAEQRTRP